MPIAYKQPGCKCWFKCCKTNKRDHPDRVFFKFPHDKPELLSQWVANCANEKLFALSAEQLRRRSVCNRHFERWCFSSDMRIRLEKNAVPTLFNVEETHVTSAPSSTTTTGSSNLPDTHRVTKHSILYLYDSFISGA